MSFDFDGKVVVVTGATSGIGEAAARLFANRGATVVVAGRRVERGRAVVDSMRASGGTATFIRTDVSDERSVAALIDETLQRHGRIDCAFNNAGVAGMNLTDITEQPASAWDAVIDTNLRGIWLCLKYELKHMRSLGTGGAIVNTASYYAHIGTDLGISPYVASKHGVLGLTRAAATEFAKHGVRVNAVSPGATRTEMTVPAMEKYPAEFDAAIRRNVLLGRVAEPIEIARAVVWLCSPEASYVTGQDLVVDGGWLTI